MPNQYSKIYPGKVSSYKKCPSLKASQALIRKMSKAFGIKQSTIYVELFQRLGDPFESIAKTSPRGFLIRRLQQLAKVDEFLELAKTMSRGHQSDIVRSRTQKMPYDLLTYTLDPEEGNVRILKIHGDLYYAVVDLIHALSLRGRTLDQYRNTASCSSLGFTVDPNDKYSSARFPVFFVHVDSLGVLLKNCTVIRTQEVVDAIQKKASITKDDEFLVRLRRSKDYAQSKDRREGSFQRSKTLALTSG